MGSVQRARSINNVTVSRLHSRQTNSKGAFLDSAICAYCDIIISIDVMNE
jgi:hypothetical protein